jgi:putative transposase
VAVDFGEIHPAVCTDGRSALLVTGRALRAHRQYLPKRLASLQAAEARKQKGSRRWWKLQKRKTRVRARLRRRIRDAEHKISRAVVDYAVERQAGTIAIGDVRDIADKSDKGAKQNQKLSTWTHGRIRSLISYKAEGQGMRVVLVAEHYSSQTCLSCGHRTKPRGRVYRCPDCGLVAHRDVVGAVNLLSRQTTGGVGQIAPPTDLKQRRPAAACRKRSMRRSPDMGHVARLPMGAARSRHL